GRSDRRRGAAGRARRSAPRRRSDPDAPLQRRNETAAGAVDPGYRHHLERTAAAATVAAARHRAVRVTAPQVPMTSMTDAHTTPPPSAPWEMRDTKLVAIGLVIAAIAAVAAQVTGLVKIQAVVGLISILLIAYLWSTNRRAIDRRTVAWGLSLQL